MTFGLRAGALLPALFLSLLWLPASVRADAAVEVFERGEFRFERGPVPAFVQPQPLPEAWPDGAPGASDAAWRNWLIDAQVDYRGSEPVEYTEHVLEATSQALLGDVSRFEIGFNPDYQRLRLHRIELRRDGEWLDRFEPARITLARREGEFESNMATGTVSALIVVSDVRVGDVVRYAYSLTGQNPVLAGQTHEEFVLAWVDPILLRTLRVLLPAGAEPAWRVIGEAASPQVRSDAKGSELVWRGERLAGRSFEDGTPHWYSQYPMLQVAAQRPWSAVVDWARELYPEGQALPADLEARIQAWQALPDAQARAAAALQAVQDEVRYFSVLLGDSTHRPERPEQTWVRRFGDCKDKAWLLATVLGRLGIEAEPALVSVARGRGVGEGLPAASQFDHVIVRARIEGSTFWLDPTLSHQRGPLEIRQAGAHGLALPIRAGSDALVPMREAEAVPTRHVVHERYTVEGDGARVRFEVDTVLEGRAAEQRRGELRARPLAEIDRDFADYYRRLHGELSVAAPLRVEDDEASGVLRTFEAYVLERPWAAQAGASRAFDLYADLVAPLAQLSGTVERRHPLGRPHPLVLEQRSEFVLPQGWTVAAPPAPAEGKDASFEYRRQVRREADRLVVEHRYASFADHVPAAAAAAHFESRRRAVAALGHRLVFGLPADASRAERSRRLRELINRPEGSP